jgi:hypothetical protein
MVIITSHLMLMQNILKLAKGWLRIGTKKSFGTRARRGWLQVGTKKSFGTRARRGWLQVRTKKALEQEQEEVGSK